jgi:hypothetical protein
MKFYAINSMLSDPFIKSHMKLSFVFDLEKLFMFSQQVYKNKEKTFFKGLIQNKSID